VGQPTLSGVVLKAYSLGGFFEGMHGFEVGSIDDASLKLASKAINIVGHWVCTHGTYHKWGVPFASRDGMSRTIPRLLPIAQDADVGSTEPAGVLDAIALDIDLHIRGAPAGAAKLFNVVAGAEAALKSPHWRYFADLQGLKALIAWRDKVRECPLTFHVDCEWLVGTVQRRPPTPSLDIVRLVSAFLQGYMPESRLARAHVFKHARADFSHPLYQAIYSGRAHAEMMYCLLK
jgi:hypothetical protein